MRGSPGLPRRAARQLAWWRARTGTRTPGKISELAFDSQKKRKNYTIPL